jgi:oligopeptide/dipeptide ABC transporter ATP-binding protein
MIAIRGLRKDFAVPHTVADMLVRRPRRRLQALRGIDFDVARGEIVGIVGESGCGKSTLGRCIAGLETHDGGTIHWNGTPVAAAGDRMERARRIQMVFQDPYASLNPRLTVGQMIGEALTVHGKVSNAIERRHRVDALLDLVGLDPVLRDRLPHAISGGQRQRISIARALAVEPELLIADEPVSALDASVQAQIINLLEDLRTRLGIAILFIAHDLNVVRHISDRIAVMYLGEVVEIAAADTLFARPLHPYTRGLLAAIPQPDPSRRTQAPAVEGEPADPLDPPSGCGFSTRCPHVLPECRGARPALREAAGSFVRCSNPAASTALGAKHDVAC